MLTIITAWTVIVLGFLIGAGGIWLVALGGSRAYAVLSLGLIVCGILLARRRRIALGVYAALSWQQLSGRCGRLGWVTWRSCPGAREATTGRSMAARGWGSAKLERVVLPVT